MRASKYFNRPVRIATAVLFLLSVFVCNVPGTPVPIYLAIAGAVVQMFSSDTDVFVDIDHRNGGNSASLRTVLRSERGERPPEDQTGVEHYPALTWQKVREMFGAPKQIQIPESELNPLNVGVARRPN